MYLLRILAFVALSGTILYAYGTDLVSPTLVFFRHLGNLWDLALLIPALLGAVWLVAVVAELVLS